MISLVNDYSEGAHPRLLEKIQELNLQANDGYGLDRYCEEAQRLIQRELGVPAAIHFVVGGTQANLTFLSAALRPHEAVISVASGHINVHETGAIEATGHKVLVAEGVAGKLTPQGIRKVVLQHEDEHMVQPRVVYISNATELGGVYTKEE
jgi:threonine aldolase